MLQRQKLMYNICAYKQLTPNHITISANLMSVHYVSAQ